MQHGELHLLITSVNDFSACNLQPSNQLLSVTHMPSIQDVCFHAYLAFVDRDYFCCRVKTIIWMEIDFVLSRNCHSIRDLLKTISEHPKWLGNTYDVYMLSMNV